MKSNKNKSLSHLSFTKQGGNINMYLKKIKTITQLVIFVLLTNNVHLDSNDNIS